MKKPPRTGTIWQVSQSLVDARSKVTRQWTLVPFPLSRTGQVNTGIHLVSVSGRMTDEINEIIRVLQLTTYDEVEWDADNLTVMKKALNAIESKTAAAHDWLLVSQAGKADYSASGTEQRYIKK